MKFYVASKLENQKRVAKLIAGLEAIGWECTYDWTTHGSVATTPDKWGTVAEGELSGVREADVVIVWMPGGRGTHVELGAALALNKLMLMVGSDIDLQDGYDYDCVFHHHPSIIRFDADEYTETALISCAAALSKLRNG